MAGVLLGARGGTQRGDSSLPLTAGPLGERSRHKLALYRGCANGFEIRRPPCTVPDPSRPRPRARARPPGPLPAAHPARSPASARLYHTANSQKKTGCKLALFELRAIIYNRRLDFG